MNQKRLVRLKKNSLAVQLIILSLFYGSFSSNVNYEKIDNDSVEHWYHTENKSNWFKQNIDKISNIVWPANNPPFGKSVALLTGVSEYEYITPDLPSVENDLNNLRKFLLGQGGFDEVYIIKNKELNRNILERYIKDVLPKNAGINGRLLFYFSGHGADEEGEDS